jgi:hypothetical protein
VIVAEIRTSDGATLRQVPAALVRIGLHEHWLEYSDEVRSASGQFVTLEEASGASRWPSAAAVAEQQFKDYRYRFAYSCTALVVTLLVLHAVPHVENSFEFRDSPSWTSNPLFVTACYGLTLFAPRIFWRSWLTALGACVFGFNLTSQVTRVGVGALIEDLDPIKLILTILLTSLSGFVVAIPFAIRKEGSWLVRTRVPIPAHIAEQYRSD